MSDRNAEDRDRRAIALLRVVRVPLSAWDSSTGPQGQAAAKPQLPPEILSKIKEAQQEHLFEEIWKGLSESEIEALDNRAGGRFVKTGLFVYLHTVCNWLTCVPGASAAL